MTKRAAMLMAAGVVLALLGGSVALSFGLSGGNTAAADPPGQPERVVRTIHRTVRVEKPAKDRPVELVTVATGSAAPAATVASTGTDDTYEDEDETYDDHEGDDDHEGEDHQDAGDHEDEGLSDDD